jgi:hypothetical protein
MRRITFWFLSTVSAVVLLFGYHTSTSGPGNSAQTVIVSEATAGASTDTTGTDSTGSGSTGSGSTGSGSTNGNGGSSGGSGGGGTTPSTTTVTGGVAQTQWGPVQVQLTMTGQQIRQVAVLQYPSGNGTDEQINSYALPILVDETMQAQSAQIDMVSGATVTSVGYLQSLQSALDQAGA